MAEVLQADALRKLKKQRQGEEDPVIVAQRFLNIYRQLHIFSEDKKNAFNKMLMELKPEIKAVFGTIPGGIVIQDYIEELEEKEGLTANSEDSLPSSSGNGQEAPQILAAALAETPAPQTPQPQPAVSTVIQQMPVSSKLEIGKDFAKELAQALSSSISMPVQSAASVDISPLISAVEQGQKELVNILRSETLDRKNENQNLTKMLLASQHQLAAALQQKGEKAADNNYLEAFKSLADNQRQLAQMISAIETNNQNTKQNMLHFFETSQQQFQQTVQNISLSQQNDTKSLVEALGNSQKELAQILHQNNTLQNQQTASTATNQNANNIQINAVDYSAQLALIAERLGKLQMSPAASSENLIEDIITAQSRLYQETLSAQTKELGSIIKLALKESQEASTETLLAALEKLPKPEVRIAEPLPYAPPPPYLQESVAVPEDIATPEPTPEPESTPEPELPAFSEEEIPPAPDAADILPEDHFVNEAPIDTDTQKKKKKKKKKKNKNAEKVNQPLETFAEDASLLSLNPDDLPVIEEMPPTDDIPLLPEEMPEEQTLPEADTASFLDIEQTPRDPFAGKSDAFHLKLDEPAEDVQDAIVPENTPSEDDTAFDWGFNNQETPVEEEIMPTTAFSWNGSDDFAALASADGNDVSPEESTPSSDEQQDWEWEYVDENDENQDWEWVYEEDGVDTTDASAPIAQNSPIYHEDSFSIPAGKSNKKFMPGNFIDIGNKKITIKDSKNTDKQDDPYKNNNLKH